MRVVRVGEHVNGCVAEEEDVDRGWGGGVTSASK